MHRSSFVRRVETLAVLFVTASATVSCGCGRLSGSNDEVSPNAVLPPAHSAIASPDNASTVGPSKTPEASDVAARMDKPMKKVLDQLASLGGKPIETLDAVTARKQPTPADAVKALLTKEGKSTAPEEVGKVEDRTIPGPGGALPIRVYTPKDAKGAMPVVLYFHGGGFVIATIDTYDASARALANAADAVVVAVEYRKAPENKFPAAYDDAVASYAWLLKNAGSVGGDPKRIGVVGESAGGNLALNVAIAARDRKLEAPTSLVLIYPVASSSFTTTSENENADAKPLSRAMMMWFTDQYFRTPADGQDTRVNLVRADLRGLPPTTIINAQIDPIRSDGEDLALAMKQAGDTVYQKTFDGLTHEFFGMGAVIGDAKDAVKAAGDRLKKSFSS